jgi:hypothetical protein
MTKRTKAYADGLDRGANAAGWWIQENGGGRDTRGPKETAEWAERMLRGWDDGDPQVYDAMTCPINLSGEWADEPTPDHVANLYARPLTGDALDDACSQWENGVSDGWYSVILKHLRDLVAAGTVQS